MSGKEYAVLEKVSNATAALATALLTCIMLAMVVFTGLQVACRYIIGAALTWPEEVNVFFMVWITFVGSSIALKRSEHIGVDLFVAKLPRKLGVTIRCLGHMVMTCIICPLTYYGGKVALLNINVVSDALEIPMIIPRFGLVAGGVMMLIQMAWLFCVDLRDCRSAYTRLDPQAPEGKYT